MQTEEDLKKDIWWNSEKDPLTYDKWLDNQQKDKVYDADNVFQYGKR